MSEDPKNTKDELEETSAPSAELLSEEEQVRIILEQARQVVKRVARHEREGEKINRELLNFRMRQLNHS
jgi:hypothetical protein